jgi:hypothetical protein
MPLIQPPSANADADPQNDEEQEYSSSDQQAHPLFFIEFLGFVVG